MYKNYFIQCSSICFYLSLTNWFFRINSIEYQTQFSIRKNSIILPSKLLVVCDLVKVHLSRHVVRSDRISFEDRQTRDNLTAIQTRNFIRHERVCGVGRNIEKLTQFYPVFFFRIPTCGHFHWHNSFLHPVEQIRKTAHIVSKSKWIY